MELEEEPLMFLVFLSSKHDRPRILTVVYSLLYKYDAPYNRVQLLADWPRLALVFTNYFFFSTFVGLKVLALVTIPRAFCCKAARTYSSRVNLLPQ